MNCLILFGLIITVTCCTAQSSDSEITQALKYYQLIPDLITQDVPETLEVSFDSGVSADKGEELTPTQTQNKPFVDWDADEDSFYTLICTDPDAPTPDDPSLKELNTWMVVNIPGKNVDSGDERFEYIGAAPPKGAGYNRYTFLVFKQPSELEFDEEFIDEFAFEGRGSFSTKNFTEKYQLEGPVAANFYRALYDDYVPELYSKLNCCFEYMQ